MTRFLEPVDPGAADIDVSLFCSECGGELTDEEITANNQDDVAEDERLCQNCWFDIN